MSRGATASAVMLPVLWSVAGYQFEAAPMVVGLGACFIVRLYVGFKDVSLRGKLLDGVILALTMLFTGGLILTRRPDPFYAILIGTGVGALGARIISLALRWVRKIDGMGEDDPDPPKRVLRPADDDERAMIEMIHRLSERRRGNDPDA